MKSQIHEHQNQNSTNLSKTSAKQIILSAILIVIMSFTQSCSSKKANEVNSSRDSRLIGKWEFQQNLGSLGGTIGSVINVIQDTYNEDGSGVERTFHLQSGQIRDDESKSFTWKTSGNNQIIYDFGNGGGAPIKYGFNTREDAMQLTFSSGTTQLYSKF